MASKDRFLSRLIKEVVETAKADRALNPMGLPTPAAVDRPIGGARKEPSRFLFEGIHPYIIEVPDDEIIQKPDGTRWARYAGAVSEGWRGTNVGMQLQDKDGNPLTGIINKKS